MAYNGSGTFLINSAGQPVVAATVISSTTFNALTADLATGLSTVITKDGQTTVTANIPMATYKFTGLGVGSAATDSATLSQVQSTVTKLLAGVSGTDTVTATASPTLTAYAAGQMFYFVAAGDNTTSVTLNIDALGAKAVTRDGSVALAAADIKSGEVVVVVYDGTRFQVVSQLNSAGDARFANVSIASSLYVGGVSTFVGNAGFSANVSIVSALSVGGVATITGAASIQGLTVGRGAGAVATNTAVGASALAANQAGGTNNTAIGNAALDANTTGDANTAVGDDALGANTTASYNTAVGYQSAYNNSTGARNAAVASFALLSNTTGSFNTALGYESLGTNTTGANNVAVGYQALDLNTTASNNTAVGYQAGYSNITGTQNTYSGYWAGYLTTGSTNSFFGYGAGSSVTTGGKNTIIGGYNGNQSSLDIRTASNHIVLSDGDGNPRGIFDASGNFLVGLTSTVQYLDGKINSVNSSLPAFCGKTSSSSIYTNVVWNDATTGDNSFILFGTETAFNIRGGITYNRAGGLVAYNTTSDYRAKDILGPVQNSGATIDALKVYEGQMKGATQSRPMLVAHEAQEHAPYTVTGEKDAVNEDGTPKYQQMDVSALVPLLLAEIQLLRKRVAQLESK